VASSRAKLFSLEQIGIKLGLEQIRALLNALGGPEQGFPSIVVAGTNGKGSTTAMIECGLRAAGYRTGRYTSPHLVDIEERFAIDGQPISMEAFDRAADRVWAASRVLPYPPTFFEATTAVALETFRNAAIDVCVLEVGLGGRLDATNAVLARAAAITRIDFDHQQHLGSTLEAIAAEKAGVIKAGQVVVLGENPAAVENVIADVAARVHARLVPAWQDVSSEVAMVNGQMRLTLVTPARRYEALRLGLRGRHQVQNAIVTVRLLEAIDEDGWCHVPADAIRSAVEDVQWPARLEWRETTAGAVLIDGAHNPGGAKTLADYLREAFGRPLPLVLGVMADKDIVGIVAELAPVASLVVATQAASPRAAAPEQLAEIVRQVAPRLPVVVEASAAGALERARQAGDPVVVAGSLYLAGEIRAGL
jgi:dihydrofolate synthase/folylpolyglutamate synthase